MLPQQPVAKISHPQHLSLSVLCAVSPLLLLCDAEVEKFISCSRERREAKEEEGNPTAGGRTARVDGM